MKLDEIIEQIMMEDRRDIEDYNIDDVMYVLGNPQKRDISVRISPVQILRDQELGINDEKYGIVIREPVSEWNSEFSLLARQKVYPRLRNECCEDD